MGKKKKDMIHFSGRKHSMLGIISVLLGFIVLFGLLGLSVYSSTSYGNGGLLLGIIGVGLFALSILGFRLAYKSCKQKDIFYRFPVIGLIINGILMVSLLVVYILGI